MLSPLRPIHPDDHTGLFSCGQPSLDEWLKHKALKSEGRTARTYVVCDGDQVVAYYCLAMGAVARDRIPPRLRRNTPDRIPVAIIGRLAVARDYQRRHLGAAMLQDALRRILELSSSVGCIAVFVQAIDEEAGRFYRKYGFQEFPAGTLTLFLAVQSISAAP